MSRLLNNMIHSVVNDPSFNPNPHIEDRVEGHFAKWLSAVQQVRDKFSREEPHLTQTLAYLDEEVRRHENYLNDYRVREQEKAVERARYLQIATDAQHKRDEYSRKVRLGIDLLMAHGEDDKIRQLVINAMEGAYWYQKHAYFYLWMALGCPNAGNVQDSVPYAFGVPRHVRID